MENIFVTGAAGFIGSNLVDRLLAGGKSSSAGTISPPASVNFLNPALSHPQFQINRR